MARAAQGAKGSGPKPKPAPAGGDLGRGAEFTNFTLALNTGQLRALKIFAIDHRTEAASVVRALLAELESDAALAAKVGTRCAEAKARKSR